MSEQNNEILTGKEGVEASQGYVPMPPSTPVASEPVDLNLQEAVEERSTAESASVVDVQYNRALTDGSRSDERSPENQSITAERAAEDLQNWRRGLGEISEALKEQALAEELERLRSPALAEVEQKKAEAVRDFDQAQAAEAAAQQSEQPVQQPGDADIARVLQENPRLIEAIQQQRQQDLVAAANAQQQAEEFVAANGRIAWGSLFADFPEYQSLLGLSPQQQQAYLAGLAQANPQRAQQFQQQFARYQNVLQASAQAEQQQAMREAQRYQAQWSQWSKEEDIKFTEAFPEMSDPSQHAKIATDTRAYMHDRGFSDDDIARAWNGQATISLRDSRAQSILYDAMRWRAAKAAVQEGAWKSRAASVPTRIMKPGVSTDRVNESDANLRALSQRLTNSPTGSASVRAAAELLAARRARR